MDGTDVTPAGLRERWASMKGRRDVLEFYGHGKQAGPCACFSNFYDQSDAPFEFEVPQALDNAELTAPQLRVRCEFSEKAIMLCKAAVMGDRSAYEQIARAEAPSEAKALGRRLQGFDEGRWCSVVCRVAFEVVHQKFAKSPSIAGILLATGDRLIAEATRNDRNWGIGINVGDPRAMTPAEWNGTNILGWALMEARAALRRAAVAAGPPSAIPKAPAALCPPVGPDESEDRRSGKKGRWRANGRGEAGAAS